MKVRRTLWIGLIAASSGVAAAPDSGTEFFEARIRPLLVEQCYECHSAEHKKEKGGLRLDTREAVLKGGDSGAALVAGDVDGSLLIKAVRYLDKDLQMPPKDKKLTAAQIADLEAWVKLGAPDPREHSESIPVAKEPTIDYAAAREQWAYRPVQRPAIPAVANAAWAKSPIDRFILARLETAKLPPAPPLNRAALLRRATFDLTGLPPTPEEADAFVADQSPDAFAKVIDRLLASPRYGERWGRHWLDVVRYTDSFDARILSGDGSKTDCTEAWRYRDWVVNAFNRDVPYDEFVREQVSGDLLASAVGQFDPEKIVATGVYAIGNWGGGDADKEKLITDIADDQVDLTARAFLGLTVACARCHDHKFDPISTADYYALAGIFFSSHILPDPGPKTNGPNMLRISLLAPQEQKRRAALPQQLAEIERKITGTMHPLAEIIPDPSKPGLISRRLKGSAEPSLTANTYETTIDAGAIQWQGRSVAVHPGPKAAVTAVWKSPIQGVVRVRGKLRDVNNACGDGVTWALRKGDATLAEGTLENGREVELLEKAVSVTEGELLRLTIGPRGEYTCDTTAVDFTVGSEDGRSWDFTADLLGATDRPVDGAWRVCAGDGKSFERNDAEFLGWQAERTRLAAELEAPEPMAHGLQEGGCPQSPNAGVHDVKVHVRGRYDRLGELVPRGFPKVLAGDARAAITQGSGRLALAEWLTRPENPLTARVMANRIWQHHFGEGIVRTPNNFGKLGTPPTHPELLDWLARRFVESGWSMKALHREIMLSAAYQQSSIAAGRTRQADPDNLLFGRMNRRRLEAEGLRDSLLFVSGQLDLTPGGPAVPDLVTPRRTLYVRTVRSDRATFQALFDAADPTAIVEQRSESTVAPQALWLLNHPFALAQSARLRERMQHGEKGDATTRISWLYRRLFTREPSAAETAIGLAMLSEGGAPGGDDAAWDRYCHALVCANEFIYVD